MCFCDKIAPIYMNLERDTKPAVFFETSDLLVFGNWKKQIGDGYSFEEIFEDSKEETKHFGVIAGRLLENKAFFGIKNNEIPILEILKARADILDVEKRIIKESYGDGKNRKSKNGENEKGGSDPTNLMGMYSREISKILILTPEEEKTLFNIYFLEKDLLKRNLDLGFVRRQVVETKKKAKDLIINANARLVISIAQRYKDKGIPFSDLIQEGNIGLMTAVNRFNPSRENKFSTFAVYWIRQGITRAFPNQLRTIRIPVHSFDQMRKMEKIYDELHVWLGRKPTEEELAKALRVPVKRVQELRVDTKDTVSFEEIGGNRESGNDDGTSWQDFFGKDTLEEEALSNLSREELLGFIERLKSVREERVLKMRFGLIDGVMMTLEEVGEKYGITRERVRQIQNEGLRKIRENYRRKIVRTEKHRR